MSSGTNIFLFVSLAVALIAVVMAVGVFLYSKYLTSTLASKQTQLAAAQSQVDEDQVEEFIRLRDRLSNGRDLLNNHVELSQFFDALESLTLQNVRFDSLKLTIAEDRTAQLIMSGTAKNFNALAAQSNLFAGDKRIKRAIFSDISLSDDKLVSFTLTADVDSKLVVEGKDPGITAGPEPESEPEAPVTTEEPPAAGDAVEGAAATTSTPLTP